MGLPGEAARRIHRQGAVHPRGGLHVEVGPRDGEEDRPMVAAPREEEVLPKGVGHLHTEILHACMQTDVNQPAGGKHLAGMLQIKGFQNTSVAKRIARTDRASVVFPPAVGRTDCQEGVRVPKGVLLQAAPGSWEGQGPP